MLLQLPLQAGNALVHTRRQPLGQARVAGLKLSLDALVRRLLHLELDPGVVALGLHRAQLAHEARARRTEPDTTGAPPVAAPAVFGFLLPGAAGYLRSFLNTARRR